MITSHGEYPQLLLQCLICLLTHRKQCEQTTVTISQIGFQELFGWLVGK